MTEDNSHTSPSSDPAQPETPPTVAVVIPLYNHARYIKNTIESVLAQTRLPDRIVIVDDGSTDDSVEVAREVADPRLEIHQQENAGAHAALNRGIALAADTCRFVAILNSDDAWLPRRLAECLDYMEDNPGIDLLVTDLELIDDDGEPLPSDHNMHRWRRAAWSRQEAWEGGEISTAEWLGTANFAMTTSNFFARTAYLRRHPMRPYRYAHDYFALAHAAITGRLGVLPEELLQYRVHAQNTIKTAPARLTRELQKVHLDLVRALAEPLTENEEYRRELANYLRAAFQNISSFRMDVFLTLCAGLAAGYSEAEIKAGFQTVTPENFPELERHPNTGIIDELLSGPISAREAVLAQELKEIKSRLSGKKGEVAPARELAKLRREIIASWWMNLGRVLGAGKHWSRDDGSTPEEKLQNLKRALRESSWFKMGKPFELPED